MLTIDDPRAREALIRTHDAFSDPKAWAQGDYVQRRGFFTKIYSRCMMGQIAHELDILMSAKKVHHDSRNGALYLSIETWLTRRVLHHRSPMAFNDAVGRIRTRQFLAKCIAELDAELIKDAAKRKPRLSLGL